VPDKVLTDNSCNSFLSPQKWVPSQLATGWPNRENPRDVSAQFVVIKSVGRDGRRVGEMPGRRGLYT